MRKILIGLILIFSITLFAQDSVNTVSKCIRVSLQSEQLDLNVPFLFNEDFEIAPNISFVRAEKIGSDLGVGLSMRKYMKKSNVSPFVGLRGGMLMYFPDGEDLFIDYVFGVLGGAEYFIDKHLSVGAELQLNCSISDEFSYRFGNPNHTNLNTASAVTVSIYW